MEHAGRAYHDLQLERSGLISNAEKEQQAEKAADKKRAKAKADGKSWSERGGLVRSLLHTFASSPCVHASFL
jgi:hypothetical protein